jgi:hypothetical protein
MLSLNIRFFLHALVPFFIDFYLSEIVVKLFGLPLLDMFTIIGVEHHVQEIVKRLFKVLRDEKIRLQLID